MVILYGNKRVVLSPRCVSLALVRYGGTGMTGECKRLEWYYRLDVMTILSG